MTIGLIISAGELISISCITTAGKIRAVEKFDTYRRFGLLREKGSLNLKGRPLFVRVIESSMNFDWLFDLETANSPGIFGKNTVKAIEQKGYKELLDESLEQVYLTSILLKQHPSLLEQNPQLQIYGDYLNREQRNPQEQLLANWRSEFIERYHEEP